MRLTLNLRLFHFNALFGYVDQTTSASPDTTTGSETTVDSTILTIDELSTKAMATLAESLHSSEQPGDISTLDALDATPAPSALPSAGNTQTLHFLSNKENSI